MPGPQQRLLNNNVLAYTLLSLSSFLAPTNCPHQDKRSCMPDLFLLVISGLATCHQPPLRS